MHIVMHSINISLEDSRKNTNYEHSLFFMPIFAKSHVVMHQHQRTVIIAGNSLGKKKNSWKNTHYESYFCMLMFTKKHIVIHQYQYHQ